MKPRHAAALALVGWYLMTPLGADHKPDTNAPLSKWTMEIRGSFDTARQCDDRIEQDLDSLSRFAADEKITNTVLAEKCIASDDPRLKQ